VQTKEDVAEGWGTEVPQWGPGAKLKQFGYIQIKFLRFPK